MKITLQAPKSPYKTVLDTEHFVTIERPSIGPILTNGDLCVSLFARDDGFEGYIWVGEANHEADSAPLRAIPFTIDEHGVHVRKE